MTPPWLTAGVCLPPTQPFEVQTEAFDSTFHLHLRAPQRGLCESESVEREVCCIICAFAINTVFYSLLCDGCFTAKHLKQICVCAISILSNKRGTCCFLCHHSVKAVLLFMLFHKAIQQIEWIDNTL